MDDLFDQAPFALVVMDQRGRIVRANSTLALWLDREAAGLVGARFQDLLTVAGRIFFETHLSPLLLMRGGFEEVALDLVGASGSRQAVTAAANVHHGRPGAPVYFQIGMMKAQQRRLYERDLLAAKASGDAARETLQEERETSELREQFIAVLGHDLRNPLAAFEAGTTLLRRKTPEELQPVLIQMQRSARRMERLINDVLDFARGRLGGGIGIARRPAHELSQMLDQVIEELRNAHPDRVIRSELVLDRVVRSDPDRIAQLASNLLANALSHGDPDQPVEVSALIIADHLELAVANQGLPIPQDIRPHLFQPFNRRGSGEVREGLGLGLYIASQIALAHDGELTVTSDADQTRFLFRMPL